MKNVQRRLSVGGKSKSHSLERSLGGIVCVCWNCAAENSVMCCTGSAHSKTAILLFLKSVWISCESEGALSTEICSRLFLFFFFFLFPQIRLLCWRPRTPWREGCSSFRVRPQTARPWYERSAGTGRNTWSALKRQVRTHQGAIPLECKVSFNAVLQK